MQLDVVDNEKSVVEVVVKIEGQTPRKAYFTRVLHTSVHCSLHAEAIAIH